MSSATTPPPLLSQKQSQDFDVDVEAGDSVVATNLTEGINHGSGSESFSASCTTLPSTAPREIEVSAESDKNTTGTGAKTIPIPSITLKRATKLSLHFRSDIDSSSSRLDGNAVPAANSGEGTATASSGIIHACRPHSSNSKGGESHAFAWISNVDDAKSTSSVMEYFQTMGYRSSSMKFIPYSSYQHWITSYPHAIPIVECDMDGNLHFRTSLNSTPAAAATTKHGKRKSTVNELDPEMNNNNNKVAKKSKSKSPPKLLANGCLPNSERDELHREIHKYFTWLHDELVSMETHASGRRLVSNAGVSVPALRSLVGKLEGAFRAVQQSCSTIVAAGGGGGGGSNIGRTRTNESTAHTNLPFLEQALQSELQRKVIHRLTRDSSATLANSATATRGEGEGELSNAPPVDENKSIWRSLDFETLYQKLIEFKEETGHASPPMKHPVLGRWVAELRAMKKGLRERGMEFQVSIEDAEENYNDNVLILPLDDMVSVEATEESSLNPTSFKLIKTTNGNTYLTQDRVQLLDAISFPWTVMPARVTWEQRLEELKQFREREGRFPTNKEGTLGNWLKGQRKLYTKNDADFMMNKRPKLDEIGVPLRQRPYSALSWDDRFQQLVEFGRVNRHFNVPNPENADMIVDPSSDAADAKRFYKFVVKLNTDYRALQRGIPSTILTEQRIDQLLNIGFEFSTKPAQKAVPDLDWTTRIQQLEAFQSEMGHLRVDPNYDKYSNIGGWANEMSNLYKSWQEGREYLSPDMINKFNQLSSMGFDFNVFPIGRGHRSWEESFNCLLQYRQETGSTRVPHHYKADFRLGSWVAVQRKEYKQLTEGKPSRITQERIQRLESIGFEWVARRGHDH